MKKIFLFMLLCFPCLLFAETWEIKTSFFISGSILCFSNQTVLLCFEEESTGWIKIGDESRILFDYSSEIVEGDKKYIFTYQNDIGSGHLVIDHVVNDALLKLTQDKDDIPEYLRKYAFAGKVKQLDLAKTQMAVKPI